MEPVEGVATVEDLDAFVARLGAIGDEHGVTVQAFDARCVVDRAHLRRAVELADRSLARGENVARDRAVEILLYAAGTRQIDRALELGVSEGECPAVVLVDAGDAGERGPDAEPETESAPSDGATAAERRAVEAVRGMDGPGRLEPAETLGEYDPDRVREYFEVSDAELDAVEGTLADAVRERVALLDVEK
ncbi:KEOPS complex Cgi121-like subunit [Halosimplex carlsbadense 2-9-1]|uniref:KEOPS complex Cgi121-like subunit n=1 Tax=Halosimplex carlsbadense 2-9-1 TaxID=797114 RepID=M0D113_9EURY|nr:KEOPS complex subunit Cgi121 [Halosimplex carlsbadense]ELZ27844.1 KEOPS complex Cgi121-like subunit [Halosimplex carlsbadense 2-9-1]